MKTVIVAKPVWSCTTAVLTTIMFLSRSWLSISETWLTVAWILNLSYKAASPSKVANLLFSNLWSRTVWLLLYFFLCSLWLKCRHFVCPTFFNHPLRLAFIHFAEKVVALFCEARYPLSFSRNRPQFCIKIASFILWHSDQWQVRYMACQRAF